MFLNFYNESIDEKHFDNIDDKFTPADLNEILLSTENHKDALEKILKK